MTDYLMSEKFWLDRKLYENQRMLNFILISNMIEKENGNNKHKANTGNSSKMNSHS